MALSDYNGVHVTAGTFLYDGTVPTKIVIIAKDHDASYALAAAEEWLKPSEEPMPVGPDGVLYYQQGELKPHRTLDEAKAWIESKGWGHITWDDAPAKAHHP